MTRELRAVSADGDVLSAFRDALAGGPALFVEPSKVSDRPLEVPASVEQRVALVVETSGSTGRPKRVALSADAVLASAAASESALGGPGQWVLALPTHYIAGLNVLARSIAAGVDPVAVHGHFDAHSFRAAAAQLTEKTRFTALVPAQLATLLDDSEATRVLADFDRVLIGGQATSPALRARAADHGIRITRTYGSSETSGGCVYDGEPIGQTAVRIEDGEVWLGGPTLAEGYLGDEALTAERFVVVDGMHWFRTADAGTFDGGRLAISGRRDDVIISGGVKVALGEIESRVRAAYPDAIVVAATDERWGEAAVVVTVDPADRDLSALLADLGPAARQTRVLHIEKVPLLSSGKPDRRALSALAAE